MTLLIDYIYTRQAYAHIYHAFIKIGIKGVQGSTGQQGPVGFKGGVGNKGDEGDFGPEGYKVIIYYLLRHL